MYASSKSKICSIITSTNYCPCGSFFNKRNCVLCPSGKYGKGGFKSQCLPCDLSTTSGDGACLCIPCPPNQFSLNGISCSCIQGYINTSSGGAWLCILCPPNQYTLDGISCVCSPGYISGLYGSCTPCIPGTSYKILINGTSLCVPCETNTYNPFYHQMACIACPDTSTAAAGINFAVSNCTCAQSAILLADNTCPDDAPQEVTAQGGEIVTFAACPAGQGTDPANGKQSCQNCTPGKYKYLLPGLTDSNYCVCCPTGTYTPVSGMTGCTSCPANSDQGFCGIECLCNKGFFKSSNACFPCIPGSFSPGPGLIGACLNCPSGTYQSSQGAQSCLACQAHENTWLPSDWENLNISVMLDSCYCNPGFFRNKSGQCNQCPSGKLSVPWSNTSQTCFDCFPAETIRTNLIQNKYFNLIDILDAGEQTPSAELLQQYQAVFVWGDTPFQSETDLGDALAQFWDSGGAVVFASSGPDTSVLGGKFGAGYSVIDGMILPRAGQEATSTPLRIIAMDPNISLLLGLQASISATNSVTLPPTSGQLLNSGNIVAWWSSGSPLIVAGSKAGRNIVALNFDPTAFSSMWPSEFQSMLVNSLFRSLQPPGKAYFSCDSRVMSGSNCS